MALPRRDTLRHTYADYLTWPDGERNEVIDGIAYVKEPPAPSRLSGIGWGSSIYRPDLLSQASPGASTSLLSMSGHRDPEKSTILSIP